MDFMPELTDKGCNAAHVKNVDSHNGIRVVVHTCVLMGPQHRLYTAVPSPTG